jgi:hypothetical protein
MPSGGDVERRKEPRGRRIFDIEDACAMRGVHVPDIEVRAVDPHLPATRTFDMTDQLGLERLDH